MLYKGVTNDAEGAYKGFINNAGRGARIPAPFLFSKVISGRSGIWSAAGSFGGCISSDDVQSCPIEEDTPPLASLRWIAATSRGKGLLGSRIAMAVLLVALLVDIGLGDMLVGNPMGMSILAAQGILGAVSTWEREMATARGPSCGLLGFNQGCVSWLGGAGVWCTSALCFFCGVLAMPLSP